MDMLQRSINYRVLPLDETHVLASKGFDRHLGYVAMSRHRDSVNLYYGKDVFQNFEHVKSHFSNLGEKELLADYNKNNKKSRVDEVESKLTRTNATFKIKEVVDVYKSLREDEKVELSKRIEFVGINSEGEEIFSTNDMIDIENQLFSSTKKMGSRNDHILEKNFISEAVGKRNLTDNQKSVIDHVVHGSNFSIINYEHGSDRQYIAGLIGDLYRDAGYIVDGMALTGMGAKNFEKESGIQSSTIYKKLWEWEGDRNRLSNKSVIIIDSANLVDTRQIQKVISEAEKAGSKVVALSNLHSIKPIAAGDSSRGFIDHCNADKIILQGPYSENWNDRARILFHGDEKDMAKGLDLYFKHGCIEKSNKPSLSVVDDWFHAVVSSGVESGALEDNLMLANSNKEVAMLNNLAREKLKERGLINSNEIMLNTADNRDMPIAVGDRLIFLRKDNNLGVSSGSLGTVQQIKDKHQIVCKLDDGDSINVNTRIYNDLNYGYGVTIYRGASMSVDNTYILNSKVVNRQTITDALGIHRRKTKLYHDYNNYSKFRYFVSKSTNKDLVADYKETQKAFEIVIQYKDKEHRQIITVSPEIKNKDQYLSEKTVDMAMDFAKRNHISDKNLSDIKAKATPAETNITKKYEIAVEYRGKEHRETVSVGFDLQTRHKYLRDIAEDIAEAFANKNNIPKEKRSEINISTAPMAADSKKNKVVDRPQPLSSGFGTFKVDIDSFKPQKDKPILPVDVLVKYQNKEYKETISINTEIKNWASWLKGKGSEIAKKFTNHHKVPKEKVSEINIFAECRKPEKHLVTNYEVVVRYQGKEHKEVITVGPNERDRKKFINNTAAEIGIKFAKKNNISETVMASNDFNIAVNPLKPEKHLVTNYEVVVRYQGKEHKEVITVGPNERDRKKFINNTAAEIGIKFAKKNNISETVMASNDFNIAVNPLKPEKDMNECNMVIRYQNKKYKETVSINPNSKDWVGDLKKKGIEIAKKFANDHDIPKEKVSEIKTSAERIEPKKDKVKDFDHKIDKGRVLQK